MVDPQDLSPDPRPICDAVELAAEDAKLLARLLLDAQSWFFACKRCLPRGTAIIRLDSPAGDAQVLIGMACEDWELRAGGGRTGGFFDPVADQIRGLLKRAFPEIASPDPRSMWKAGAIAKLKEGSSPR